jgi:hypothetical protein
VIGGSKSIWLAGESYLEDRVEGQPKTCYRQVVLPWAGLRNKCAPLGFSSPTLGCDQRWIAKLCTLSSALLEGMN